MFAKTSPHVKPEKLLRFPVRNLVSEDLNTHTLNSREIIIVDIRDEVMSAIMGMGFLFYDHKDCTSTDMSGLWIPDP